MHSRMNEWVAMSPQDRAAARLNFAKTKELSKQLTADEKKAKWETYQAKPVPTQKLAVTPKNLPPLPKVPASASATTTGETAMGATSPAGKPN